MFICAMRVPILLVCSCLLKCCRHELGISIDLTTKLRRIISLPWNADRPSSTGSSKCNQVEPVAIDTKVPLAELDLAFAQVLVAER
mmetsp:Transcript_94370/g.163122  ORF Transcript_94370/g.163122 Transcript_94370/m.163122 type:complete len:86 (+) Transcript_94370:164-421(+)